MVLYFFIILIFVGILAYNYVFYLRTYYSILTINKLREIRFKLTMQLSDFIEHPVEIKTIELLRGLHSIINASILRTESVGSVNFKGVRVFFLPYLVMRWEKNEIKGLLNGNELAKEYAIEVQTAIKIAIKAIPFFYIRVIFFFLKAIFYTLLIKVGFKGFKKKMEPINDLINGLHQLQSFPAH
jgi:hypothetical protein